MLRRELACCPALADFFCSQEDRLDWAGNQWKIVIVYATGHPRTSVIAIPVNTCRAFEVMR